VRAAVCGPPRQTRLLLLARDRLGRTLAGASVGVGALAADGESTTVAQATIVAQIHKPLDVHRDVAAEVTFHDVVAVDGLANLDDFGVGQLIDAALRAGGRVRVSVTVPFEPVFPKLFTPMESAPALFWPATRLPGLSTTGKRSTKGVATGIVDEAVLFAGFVSPPPETVTVLVTEAGALAAIATTKVICG